MRWIRADLTLAAGMSLLLLGACAPPAEETAEPVEEMASAAADEAALRQIAGDWQAANNGGSVDGLMALYAGDAVRMGPGAPLEGADAIRAGFEEGFAAGTAETVLGVEDVQIAGDRAYTRGTWRTTFTPEEGEAVENEGKWLTVSERQDDGSWKIVVDSFNSNLPPQS